MQNIRRGIGGKLLDYLISLANTPKILVGTWEASIWVIHFYEEHGFKLVSQEERERLLCKYWASPLHMSLCWLQLRFSRKGDWGSDVVVSRSRIRRNYNLNWFQWFAHCSCNAEATASNLLSYICWAHDNARACLSASTRNRDWVEGFEREQERSNSDRRIEIAWTNLNRSELLYSELLVS